MSLITGKPTQVRGRVRLEHGSKRIRAYLGGELVADTTRPLLVWEKPYYPTYYFPIDDARTDLFSPDGRVVHSPSRGDGQSFTICAGGKQAVGAALRFEQSPYAETLEDAGELEQALATFERKGDIVSAARSTGRPSHHPRCRLRDLPVDAEARAAAAIMCMCGGVLTSCRFLALA